MLVGGLRVAAESLLQSGLGLGSGSLLRHLLVLRLDGHDHVNEDGVGPGNDEMSLPKSL